MKLNREVRVEIAKECVRENLLLLHNHYAIINVTPNLGVCSIKKTLTREIFDTDYMRANWLIRYMRSGDIVVCEKNGVIDVWSGEASGIREVKIDGENVKFEYSVWLDGDAMFVFYDSEEVARADAKELKIDAKIEYSKNLKKYYYKVDL